MAESELRWLLSEYVPRRHAHIAQLLGVCRQRVLGGAEVATLVVSTPGSDALKGFIVVNGCRIVKAEMNVHVAGSSRPVTVALSSAQIQRGEEGSERPAALTVELRQLAAAGALVDNACEILSVLEGGAGLAAARGAISDAAAILQRARSILDNEDSQWPAEQPARMLLGAPVDWIVSFGIQNCRVVTEIASISQATSASASQSAHRGHHRPSSSVSVGGGSILGGGIHSGTASVSRSAVIGGGNVPGVLVRVQSDYPALMSGVELISRCAAYLCDLSAQLDKIAALV